MDVSFSEDEIIRLIAIHESGHCVISYILGHKFDNVYLITNPKKESSGTFKQSISDMPKKAKDMDFHDYVKEQIIILLSGAAAVHIQYPNIEEYYLGAGPDIVQAASLAKIITSSKEDTKGLISSLAFQTKVLLQNKKYLSTINLLADELIKKKTLSFIESVKIIEDAFNSFDFDH